MDKTTGKKYPADGGASGSNSQEKNGRKRKEPSWYGDRMNFNDSSSAESADPFADNSFEDKDYTPEKRRKKSSIDGDTIESTICSNNSSQFVVIDLNNEINKANEKSSSGREMETVIPTRSETARIIASPSIELNEVIGNNQTEIHMNLLKKLYENSIEILARVSVMEEAMLKNGSFKPKSEKKTLSKEHFDAFMKSNNLPLKSLEHMQTFENNLKDVAFAATAVSIKQLFSTA